MRPGLQIMGRVTSLANAGQTSVRTVCLMRAALVFCPAYRCGCLLFVGGRCHFFGKHTVHTHTMMVPASSEL